MGLAGRKDKQRIGNDPRNLTWADDASKFGQSYLSKLGWDPSKGLGATGDGMKSHISVTQRLNLLGIGAGAKQGAEDIAWKQSRDYELVLKRLNATAEGTTDVVEMEITGAVAEGGFVKADSWKEGDAKERGIEDEGDLKKEKKKKRKKEGKEDGEQDKSEKKKSKKRRKGEENASEPDSSTAAPTPIRAPIARPMAHRARFLKSKRMALENSTAMLEILGVSSSSASPSSSYPSTPAPGLSSSSTPGLESAFSLLTTSTFLSGISIPAEKHPEPLETLTTSTKSMSDYFKEKLAAKSKTSSPITPSPLSREVPDEESESAPRRGLGSRSSDKNDGSASSGIGFGSSMKFSALMGFGATGAPTEEEPVASSSVADNQRDTQTVVSLDKGKEKEKKFKKKDESEKEKKNRCKENKAAKRSDEDSESLPSQSSPAEAVDRTQNDDEGRERKKKKKKKTRADDE